MYEGYRQNPRPHKRAVTDETLSLDTNRILEAILNVSTQLDQVNSKIDALIADEVQLVAAVGTMGKSVGTMGEEYTLISTDIKNMLIEIQNSKGVDLSGVISKIEEADKTVQTVTTTVQGATASVEAITAKAKADDKSVNPSGPSNFGEVPA